MNTRILYCLSFSILSIVGYSQDIIVKKDSSKITSKLTEINPQEIKYTRFDNVNGPTYVISKSEVAYVVYENGITEFFKSTDNHKSDHVFINTTPLKEGTKRPDSIGNHIKFNLQLGVVINSLSSNYTSREPSQSHISSETYSASSGKNVYNFNLGFNFLFGSNPYVKHLIGVNYLRSSGEYNYRYSIGGYTSYDKNFHYISKIDFINVVTGLRFKLFKKLYIEPLIAINIIAQSDIRYSGYATTTYISGGPTPSVYKKETEYYSNQKVDAERSGINSTISLCPRISYDFNLKKQTLGVYVSYNLAYKYRLPWMMAGFTYYPFKKLSPTIYNKKMSQNTNIEKKRKLFNGVKLNIDAAAVMNRGFTNTQEKYSGIKPANPSTYKTGYSMGVNLYHGKTSYFKHYISAFFIQSQADLLRKTYTYSYENNNAYRNEIINTTTYSSKVGFINFGTGIRLTAFKHLNFDNGIAFNMPIYSQNIIQHDEIINRYDNYNHLLISSNSLPTESTKSHATFIEDKNWLFTSKIGYDFNIKQSKFGLFYGWNLVWKNKAQWHMLGITYYPFKKLR